MRGLMAASALMIAAMPGTALADTRATYRDGQGGTMVIEAADNGASRIQMSAPPEAAALGITGPVVSFTTSDGAYFVVIPTATRVVTVNVADVVAVANEMTERYLPADLPLPPELAQFQMRRAGEETVAGRQGIRYVFDFPKPPAAANQGTAPPPPPMDFVVSNDEDLRPLARAWVPAFNSFRDLRLIQRFGMMPIFQQMDAVFRESAVLRAGQEFTLTKVEQITADPARYQVPGTPVGREEIRTQVQAWIGTMTAPQSAPTTTPQPATGGEARAPKPIAPPPPSPRK
jgi:hypothetical protein